MIWNQDPILFHFNFITVRWYGVFFALGIFFALTVTKKICRIYNYENIKLDSLFNYIVLGTVIGARLGHCLFYNPSYYLKNPFKILYIWEGGLASHGALIGIFVSLLLFSKKYKIKLLPLADLLASPASLTGGFIRIGNFFNSEILGSQTARPWAIIFSRIDNIPRHPTQLYEALFYFAVFYLLLGTYLQSKFRNSSGRITGLYLALTFTFRFCIEFFKLPQSGFENSMIVNMGQLLSLPLIAIGMYLLLRKKTIIL